MAWLKNLRRRMFGGTPVYDGTGGGRRALAWMPGNPGAVAALSLAQDVACSAVIAAGGRIEGAGVPESFCVPSLCAAPCGRWGAARSAGAGEGSGADGGRSRPAVFV